MKKCSKCGAVLPDDAQFCLYCGNKIENCTSDNSEKKNDSCLDYLRNDFSEINNIVDSAEFPDHTSEEDSYEQKFKVNTYTVMLLIIILLLLGIGILSWIYVNSTCYIVVLLQIVLLAVSILMKNEVIKISWVWMQYVSLILAVTLTVPYTAFFKEEFKNIQKINWNEDITLSNVIPDPGSEYAEVGTNTTSRLFVLAYQIDEDDYHAYIDTCKQSGFSIDSDESYNKQYFAFNPEGYRLSLHFLEQIHILEITVTEPDQYEPIVWPENEITAMIPVPSSATGYISRDNETGVSVTLSETSKEDYQQYVLECADKGFTINAQVDDNQYTAENSQDYTLCLSYEGNNVMEISIHETVYDVSFRFEYEKQAEITQSDISIYVDDSLLTTLSPGFSEYCDATLQKGEHELRLVSTENPNLLQTLSVDIREDGTIRYQISNDGSQILVDNSIDE